MQCSNNISPTSESKNTLNMNHYLEHIHSNSSNAIFSHAASGSLELCMKLVGIHGNLILNQTDKKGMHVLHYACMSGNISLVGYILTMGKINDSDVLLSSLSKNSSNEDLIKIEATHEVIDEEKSTPMHIAARLNKVKLIEFLINIGVTTEILDAKEKTPLLVACSNGNIDSVIFLISNGANIYAEDNEKDTCLHWACYYGHTPLIHLFTNLGLDINKQDSFGQTGVHLVCISHNPYAVDVVLKNNPDLYIYDKQSRRPLEVAVEKKFIRGVEKLRKFMKTETLLDRIRLFLFPFTIVRSYFIFSMLLSTILIYVNLHISDNNITFPFMFVDILLLFGIFSIIFLIRRDREPPQSINSHIYFNFLKEKHTCDQLIYFLKKNTICHACKLISSLDTIHCVFSERCYVGYEDFDIFNNRPVLKRNKSKFLILYTMITLFSILMMVFCLKVGLYITFLIFYPFLVFLSIFRLFFIISSYYKGISIYQLQSKLLMSKK